MARRITIGLWWLMTVCLFTAGGCAPEPNVDPKSETSSNPQSLSEKAMSLWQRDIEQYRLHTQDAMPIRPQAEEFLRTVQLGMLPEPRGPGLATTAAMGKRLLETGCHDPLVRCYYGRAIYSNQGYFEAIHPLVDALNDFQRSDYPPEYQRVGLLTYYSELVSRGLVSAAASNNITTAALSRVGDATIPAGMERVVLYELSALYADDCGKNWQDQQAVYEACLRTAKIDPWLLNMMAGRAFLSQAWHHRGGEWAYKVKPESWKPFQEDLRKAAEHFTAALKLHSDYPEAATDMIAVAMAGESDQTPKEWFDKAVAAQFDYMRAYSRLRWAIRPRWGGNPEAMYQFGCQCADSKRYDTQVPFVLLQIVDDIDDESGYNGAIWRQEGVYPRVKRMLEGMASDPSRSSATANYPTKWSVMSIHAAMAERAGQHSEAKRLLDELGDRFDRRAFDNWCAHPDWVLADIYVNSGKGAGDVQKAWQTLVNAPKPISDEVIEKSQALYRKAMAADPNEWSQSFCESWLDDLECRKAFNAGKWSEKPFDQKMLCWAMAGGTWSAENKHSAIGYARRESSRVQLRPRIVPPIPLEIEFDIEVPKLPKWPLTLGLFIPEEGEAPAGHETCQQCFVRTGDNVAGIEIGGKPETVPCKLKPVNRIRVQFADGRAVLSVNDQFCLERSDSDFHPPSAFNLGCQSSLYPHMTVRISNVRIRKWDPTK